MSFCDSRTCRLAVMVAVVLSVALLLLSCGRNDKKERTERNNDAERMLSGVWFNEDDNSIAFRAEKDTIYYSDSTCLPVHFRIIADTLYLDGSEVLAYPIEKQSEHLFVFKNNQGDRVRLVKTTDEELEELFDERQHVSVLNQNRVVKTDTAFVYDDTRFHSYVQVNPTTYKLIKTSVNNDGVTVDNVYYDNIVHISIYRLAEQLFSKDFNKEFFKNYVPKEFYEQSILGDMTYIKCDSDGFHYSAALYIPDSMISFLVNVTVSFGGDLSVSVNEGKAN